MLRQLYVSLELQTLLDGPWVNDEWEERFGYMKADFHRFVTGEMIALRLPPSKDVEANIAKLEPPEKETWDIRCSAPPPQLRVFGRFAGLDVFVALTWKLRSWLDDDLDKWQGAIDECRREWGKLFASFPHSGETEHDYITKKVRLV